MLGNACIKVTYLVQIFGAGFFEGKRFLLNTRNGMYTVPVCKIPKGSCKSLPSGYSGRDADGD